MKKKRQVLFQPLDFKSLVSNGIYIFVGCLGILIAFYPTLLSGFSFMQTDPGDTRLVNYFLEHSFQSLTNINYAGDLWSPAFFYPHKKVLAFSENMFGSAPIYWLFRAFLSSDLAFQVWMITVSFLNFVSFAVLLNKYKVRHTLSALGAFLFAFSMPRIAKIGHQQLLPQFFTPLTFWVVWDFVKQPTRKRLTLLLLLTYLQVLAGIYLGWFLLLSLFIFFGVAYKLNTEAWNKIVAFWRSDRKAIIAIILGWVALVLFTLLPYLEAKSISGGRSYAEVDAMLPRISSWFSVPPGSLWSPVLAWVSQGLPIVWEHYMFAGFTLVILTGLSIYRIFYLKTTLTFERALLVKSCLLVFIILFSLSVRLPFGLSLWRIIYEIVPGASVIRGVTRIWTVAYFFLLIAVIVCFDSLLNTLVLKKQWRLLIASGLLVIGISEQIVLNLPSFEKAPLATEITEIRELMKQQCDLAYVSLHPQRFFVVDQISAMWAGIESNIPVVNGYSGLAPPKYGDNSKSMNTAQVVNWLEVNRRDNTGKLCMIYFKSLEKGDTLLPTYSVQKTTSSSGAFTSYTLQLPLSKAFSQEIKVFEALKNLETQASIKVPVIVKNTSNFLWSPTSDNPTHFSYRWIDANGQLANFEGDGDRTPLPYDLSPGESVALNATIKTPTTPGKYKLILTMVQEAVAWFNDKTTNYLEINVEVVSPK